MLDTNITVIKTSSDSIKTELKISNNLMRQRTNKPLSLATIKNLEIITNDFNNFNRGRPITPDTAIEYVRHLKDTYKLSTAKMKKDYFKRVLKENFPTLYLPENIKNLESLFKTVALPEVDQNKTNKVISEDDYNTLIKTLKPRESLFIKFLYNSGCRVSELLNCQTKDITIKGKVVYISIIGKGDKARELRTPLELYKQIKNTFGDGKYLFNNNRSKSGKFSRQYVYSIIHKIKLEDDIRYSPHNLRHSVATDMLKSGLTLKEVSEFLGHSSVATTSKYYDRNTMDDKRYLKQVRL